MSASKPSGSALWRTAERMLDEEADRLAGLSDEEFLRAMSELPKPARTPTLEQTMADVHARIRERRRKSAAGADPDAGAGAAPRKDKKF